MRRGLATARVVSIAALLAAIVVVGYLVLGGGGGYTVTARFISASQLVKGNRVDVAGLTVGSVKDISLTDDGQAAVKVSIDELVSLPEEEASRRLRRKASGC